MNSRAKVALAKAKTIPGFINTFNHLFAKSEQVILFGSFAAGLNNETSDIDLLFVTNEEGVKTSRFDFICISPEKVTLKSWLGSELANHIAKYGIWIKGKGSWRTKVFVSADSIDRKKIIILTRFAHLWVKSGRLNETSMFKLLEEVVLDAYRLILLKRGVAIPPNALLKKMLTKSGKQPLNELTKQDFLGEVGRVYLRVLLKSKSISGVDTIMKRHLRNS